MSVSEKESSPATHGSSEGGGGETTGEREYKRAVRRAMDLLAVRVHSIHQLRVKLARKFTAEVVERVIERLAEMGLLDDLEFACEYVRQRIERSPRAPALLVNELGRRGVTGSTAAEAVNRALSEMELAERDLAERAVRKKLDTLAEIDTEQLKSKLFRFLSSRGFQASTARRVIEKMLGSF